ncbi:aminotransferase [Sedimentimonas flavescens]|uniref:Aminotransferase n=1 Tax=Sedimentimonas flavescens TaxID=2851012 RepID=A0ABT2ZX96_9RHOB|nr:aminotransferase [Sedimentimonas flavescens]MCV2878366.1 aminotransferase [Sedimentimonas flavescens]
MFAKHHSLDPVEIAQVDKRHVLHPWSDLKTMHTEDPLVLAEAKGIHISDAEGNRYIDGIGGMWCVQVGYGREELIVTMAEQARRLCYYTPFGAMANVPAAQLAQALAERAPGDLNTVSFATSGSGAVDSAIRFAHFYFNCLDQPSKRQVIVRMDSYHGSTYLTASMNGKRRDWSQFNYARELVHFLPSVNAFRRPKGQSLEDFANEKVADLEAMILELGPENVACFVAEPIQASGGVIVPPEMYLPRCLEICRKYDVLYISDEVVTAFGRLGHIFASKDVFGITPDIITCAKGLTSGYIPMGATIYSDRLIKAISGENAVDHPYFTNGFTYSGHPVAAAVALKNLEILEGDGILEQVRDTGPYFQAELQKLRDLPIVGDVRGMGLMACVECVVRKIGAEPGEADMAVAARVDAHAQERGLILRPFESLCILSPPLIVTTKDIDRIVSILRDSLIATQNDLIAEGIWSPLARG